MFPPLQIGQATGLVGEKERLLSALNTGVAHLSGQQWEAPSSNSRHTAVVELLLLNASVSAGHPALQEGSLR